MIRIKIGDSERDIADADPNWINAQINGLKRDGKPVCVRVFIKLDSVDVMLSTPDCGGTGGGGRQPNAREKEIFDKWEKLHLNSRDFTGGNVVAFLKQIVG